MHATMRKILVWSFVGGIVAFIIDWMVSGGQPIGHRIMLGLMCFGGGFVTGGMIAANFAKDEDDSHAGGHGAHGSGGASPPAAAHGATPGGPPPPSAPGAHGHHA